MKAMDGPRSETKSIMPGKLRSPRPPVKPAAYAG
jgi:hypothetical protein